MNSRHRKDTASSQILPSHLEFLAQLAHGRSKHKSVKITVVPFRSVGITGSKAETESKKRQTQNKQVMSEVTPPKSPDSNKTGLTRYNKTDPTDSVWKDWLNTNWEDWPNTQVRKYKTNFRKCSKQCVPNATSWNKLNAARRWFIPRSHHIIPHKFTNQVPIDFVELVRRWPCYQTDLVHRGEDESNCQCHDRFVNGRHSI